MRFLHAADIHLDSPLGGMGRRDPDLARLTGECTRKAFINVIDLAIAQQVDFVVIAGDLYDTEHKNFETGLFFAEQMRLLARPCVMIHGNHDSAESQITRALHPPPNVTVLPSHKPGTKLLPEAGAAIHGQSFAARAETNDLAAHYPARAPGLFNIGLLHSSVENPGEHAAYAPCRVETLVSKGYDYWALGHIHTRRTLEERPHIHFPGNPQGRHVRETGSRGVTVVDMADGAAPTLTYYATDVLRWSVCRVDVSGVESIAELVFRVRHALAAERLTAEGRPLIVRIILKGATALHAELLARPAKVDSECLAAARSVGGDVHVECVKLETRPPEQGETDLAGLRQAVLEAMAEPGLIEALLKDFADLDSRIPSEAEPDVPRTRDAVAALQDDAWSIIRHALRGPDPAA